MKKVFGWILVIGLVISLLGCTEQQINSNSPISTPEIENTIDKLKKECEVEYIGKDIEYNLKNMKDESFLLVGIANLSDYYNYGFDDTEEKLFCVKIEPMLDTSKEDWYIYLDREYWKDYYDELVGRDSVYTVLVCEISTTYYQDGQNQLAYGNAAYWNK